MNLQTINDLLDANCKRKILIFYRLLYKNKSWRQHIELAESVRPVLIEVFNVNIHLHNKLHKNQSDKKNINKFLKHISHISESLILMRLSFLTNIQYVDKAFPFKTKDETQCELYLPLQWSDYYDKNNKRGIIKEYDGIFKENHPKREIFSSVDFNEILEMFVRIDNMFTKIENFPNFQKYKYAIGVDISEYYWKQKNKVCICIDKCRTMLKTNVR